MAQDTIEIKKPGAQKAYALAKSGAKAEDVLEALFGKENLIPADITERVKSYKDACEVEGIDPDVGMPFLLPVLTEEQKAINAFYMLRVIAKALNEEWTPDWKDNSQRKHFPFFENNGSGFRFYDSVDSYCGSSVGSRLCFKSEKLSTYAGKQFCDLYNQMYSL